MKKWSVLFIFIFGIFSFHLACNTDTTLTDEKSQTESTTDTKELIPDAGHHECKREHKREVCLHEQVQETKVNPPEETIQEQASQPEKQVKPEKENIPKCPLHSDLRNYKLPCDCFGYILRDPGKALPFCNPPNKVSCCPGRKKIVCD